MYSLLQITPWGKGCYKKFKYVRNMSPKGGFSGIQGTAGCLNTAFWTRLWLHADTALDEQGITCYVFCIIAGKEHTYLPDILLRIPIPAKRNLIQVFLKHLRIFLSPLGQLIRHDQGKDHVHINIIWAPFIGSYPGQAADSFFCSSVGALSRLAGDTCAGCELMTEPWDSFRYGNACFI